MTFEGIVVVVRCALIIQLQIKFISLKRQKSITCELLDQGSIACELSQSLVTKIKAPYFVLLENVAKKLTHSVDCNSG